MNGNDNTTAIRIRLDTYVLLDKLKQKKRTQNLKEKGKVGDADFDSIIMGLLKGNANNYQPLSGEESKPQGGNKHEQMAKGTSTQPDSKGLDNAQRESHRANEKRVEDPTGKAGKIESIGGEDASL